MCRPNRVPPPDVESAGRPDQDLTEDLAMQDAKIYRQFAADCRRMANTMNAKDRQTLLTMAEAWDMRAEEAERRERKNNGEHR